MRISVETDPSLLDTEVLIRCVAVNDDIDAIVASLSMHDRKVVAKRDGETLLVPASEVLYFESVDRRTFAYTSSAVLMVPYRLYELEERYAPSGFERIAKSCIVNLCRVDALCPYVGGRLLATLDNGEKVIVSRGYAGNVRTRLSA